MRRPLALIAAGVLTLSFAACGGDDDVASDASTTTTTESESTTTTSEGGDTTTTTEGEATTTTASGGGGDVEASDETCAVLDEFINAESDPGTIEEAEALAADLASIEGDLPDAVAEDMDTFLVAIGQIIALAQSDFDGDVEAASDSFFENLTEEQGTAIGEAATSIGTFASDACGISSASG
jgi:hypothetical protein